MSRKHVLTVRVSDPVYRTLEAAAARLDVGVSTYARALLERSIGVADDDAHDERPSIEVDLSSIHEALAQLRHDLIAHLMPGTAIADELLGNVVVDTSDAREAQELLRIKDRVREKVQQALASASPRSVTDAA